MAHAAAAHSRCAMEWQRVTARIREACAPHGLDLVQPFAQPWYDQNVPAECALPDIGRANALGVLIGNTRAIWAPFVAHLRAHPAAIDAPDPLDAYVVATIRTAM